MAQASMLRPFLMGLVAGQRSMTPLAVLAGAARRGTLPDADNPGAKLIGQPLIAAGAVALAAGEMAGDKMKTAPDRIVPLGLAARAITASFAGYTLAPGKEQRLAGAAVCAATALAASWIGWSLRMKAMRRWGQTPTGFAEEAIVLPAAWAVADARA